LVDIIERDQASDARRLLVTDARPASRAAH